AWGRVSTLLAETLDGAEVSRLHRCRSSSPAFAGLLTSSPVTLVLSRWILSSPASARDLRSSKLSCAVAQSSLSVWRLPAHSASSEYVAIGKPFCLTSIENLVLPLRIRLFSSKVKPPL